MSKEGFFRRWARLKTNGESAPPPAGPAARHEYLRAGAVLAGERAAAPAEVQAPGFEPLAQTALHPPVAPPSPSAAPGSGQTHPTLDDVAMLGPDSDFSSFMMQGVDKAVQRMAMKKLFSDPHFSVMDGLDVYIDDYTKADPLPAAMLASLQHARSVFARFLDDDNKNKDAPGQDPKDQRPDLDPPPQGNA